MTGYTDTFAGTPMSTQDPTYLPLSLTGDQTLYWPVEQQINQFVLADIIDISADDPGRSVTFPDARQGGKGYSTLLNNVGTNTVTILDAAGGTILSLSPGTAWCVYMSDDTTEAGVWRVFQLGATVSVSNASALAGAGLKAIGAGLNQSMQIVSLAVDTTIVSADRAKLLNWTSGAGEFTLPSPASVGADWFVGVRNSGDGNLTLTPAVGDIDGELDKAIAPGESAFLITDGNDFFSLGHGKSITSGLFDFVSISVVGSGGYTLSGAQLNRISYRFTGLLTGNRTIIVPNTAQQYWVDNQTTGAYTLSVGTAAQVTPVEVPQGSRVILYCDGTDVLDADTGSVSFPIAVSLGGTGSGTVAGALANLGADAKYLPKAGGNVTGEVNMQDNVLKRPELTDYSETKTAPTISGGVLTLDLETGNTFDVALNSNITTLTISNPPASGKVGSFTLVFTADGTLRTVAWPASVKWSGGTAPTLTSTNGKKDIFTFFTMDAGTSYFGFVAGQNF